jgi:3-methyladenine DNA glycosylase AlkD
MSTLDFEEYVRDIKEDLQKVVNPSYYESHKKNYPDSEFHYMGVPTPEVRRIAKKFLKRLKDRRIRDIEVILGYCNKLLEKKISELRTIAIQWSFQYRKQLKPKHYEMLEEWLDKYVTGWGSCDNLCISTFGYFLCKNPEFIPRVKKWVSSPKPMTRRASAVSFIFSLRRGRCIEHIFEIADALLNDKEDLVLKGYGWMLKEATKRFQDEVYEYVIKNKTKMPRVSLRYAIEKMPQEMRKIAMAKN